MKRIDATLSKAKDSDVIVLQPRVFVRGIFRVVRLLFIVSTIVFVIFSVLPSDPIRSIVGVNATEEAIESLRHEFGYDQPLVTRYFKFLESLFRFDFGRSLVTRRPVGPDFGRAYLLTLGYVSTSLGIGVTLSFIFLVLGFLGPPFLRKTLLSFSVALTSFPSLVIATSVGVFLVRIGFLGGNVLTSGRGFLLAVASLAVYPTFSLTELALKAIHKIESAQSVVAVRSLGFTELKVLRYCLLRPILLPWLGHLSNIAASLVAGSIIVEAVFSLPGLGRLLIQSVLRGDLPMIQGIIVASVLGFVFLDWTTKLASDVLIGRVYR